MMNYNSLTEAVYSVANQESLEGFKLITGVKSDEWAGFQQWIKIGRKVKKGAKGAQIKIVVTKKIKNKDEEDEKKTVCKNLYVFNKDMTETIEK